jgi:hypothetical protein
LPQRCGLRSCSRSDQRGPGSCAGFLYECKVPYAAFPNFLARENADAKKYAAT